LPRKRGNQAKKHTIKIDFWAEFRRKRFLTSTTVKTVNYSDLP
tara:strand:+ start:1031 stop:1159 length:129 start_codon:yes stop_codon:yes gene_type:complete